MSTNNREIFVIAYRAAIDFASSIDEVEYRAAEWSEALTDETRKDAEAFYDAHEDDIQAYCEGVTQAGHDLWFTRCGHGCGYWENSDEVSTRLDEAAKALGNVDLYVGDDGKVYAS